MSVDPFTEVLQKLWEILEANSDFATAVKAGNRGKLWVGNVKPPIKDELSNSDVPYVSILPVGSTFNPFATSTDAIIEQTYGIRMVDGNLKINSAYFPLKFYIIQALANVDALLGLSYVRKIDVGDGTDDNDNSSIPGWEGGIDITVTMIFNRITLKSM